jgi:competence protein ComGC
MQRKRIHHAGFSLVELLIVLAIILILISIVLPNISKQRKDANEAAAAANIRGLRDMENSFKNATGHFGTLAELANSGHLQDQSIGRPPNTKQGYVYSSQNVSADSYQIFAVPVSPNSGVRSFCVDDSGTIKFGGDAGTSPPTMGSAANCSSTLP